MAVLNGFRHAHGAEYLHGNRKGCLKGTRRAVLDKIEFWTRDSNQPSVYWLNGLAGTGKSTIAQTIAERTFADGRLGGSFFCSRDFEERRNLQFVFPTLAVQLARKYTELRPILVQLMQQNPGIVDESLSHQMEKLIVRPLRDSSISTVIVIDALDECGGDEATSAIFSVLGQSVSEIPMVKFFLTSRPEPWVQEGFRLLPLAEATNTFILHEVEPSQVGNDILLFFKHQFSELAARRGGLDDWPTTEHLNLLCDRAAGLFVYAVATAKFIDNKNKNPRVQLDAILQSPKSSAYVGETKVRSNKTLDSLYMSILQEAFGNEDDPEVRSVLGAVVLAANPLSPSAISALLGIDPTNVFLQLSSIHSLLILHDNDKPVQPFHKSFPDFVTNQTRCTNLKFHVSPPDHHSELLIGCLGLMNQRLEKNMCGLPDALTNDEVDDLWERTKGSIDYSLQYACESWHKHLVDPHTVPVYVPKITSVLHQFLEKKFLFWLEVLSVLGIVRVAVDALEVTAKWLEVC